MMTLKEATTELLKKLHSVQKILDPRYTHVLNPYFKALQNNPTLQELYAILPKLTQESSHYHNGKWGGIIKTLIDSTPPTKPIAQGLEAVESLKNFADDLYWKIHDKEKFWYVMKSGNGTLRLTNDPNPTLNPAAFISSALEGGSYVFEGTKLDCLFYMGQQGFDTSDVDIFN